MKPAQRYYLLAYNGFAFLAWLAFGIAYFIHSPWVLPILVLAQGLAILEIIHAATGIVRSPVGSTAAQVASRILVVVLLLLFVSDGQWFGLTGFLIVTIAWTITELVRYSFYFAGLLGREPHWLLVMRYTFFIILYPLGVTGEWFIILSPLLTYGLAGSHDGRFWIFDQTEGIPTIYYAIFTGILAISYIYYFPVLYRYMWRQRSKKLSAN